VNAPPIEHVFVLMLENRSFDHMLGFSGIPGLEGLTGKESNPLPSGQPVTVSEGADWVLDLDPGHGFDDVLEQLCGRGATFTPGGPYPPVNGSGFVTRIAEQLAAGQGHGDPSLVMRCFRPDQLPVLNALAREFAVCDHWFSSLPGPTWPNRLFAHAASSGGLDDSPSVFQEAAALLEGYRFENGHIFDRLDAAGRSWRIVEGDALPQSLSLHGMVEHALAGRVIPFEEFQEQVASPAFAPSYVFIEPSYGHVFADGSNFKCGNSQHPLDDVTRGERLLKDVYETIRRSPAWPRSLLIVTYDEHGGFFDHVLPPEAVPPGDRPVANLSHRGFMFDRLGARVPAVVVSPYTARGTVDHTQYEHSSIPASLERLFGLEAMTARDRAAATLEGLCALPAPRTDAPETMPEPPVSGVPDCEDTLEHRLASFVESLPAELAGPVEPAIAGFLHVAIARELHLAAAANRDVPAAVERERERLLGGLRGIRTKLDAAKYLHDVSSRYRAFRG
jgi:phospholipase C